MRHEIKLPKKIIVNDYHEFYSIRDIFKRVDRKIKVREIAGGNEGYAGIIYIGNLNEPENSNMIKKIIKET